MKKILVGICLVLFMAITEVSASEILVTIPNTLDGDYVCSEDLIKESSVDWDNVGEGRIDYFNKSDMSFLSKDVIISDISGLEAGINIPNINNIKINELITINKIIRVKDGEFFILGKIDTKNYPYVSEGDNEFAYIAYYEQNAMQWSRILKESRYGTIVDGVITSLGLAVIGHYESYSQKSNVFISILSFNNKIIYDREIEGSLNDYARSLYYNNEVLIFTGVTESKDGNFSKYTEVGFDIFVGNIDLATKSLDIYLTGNRGNDVLISSTFLNGYIYLYAHFRGEGFFYNTDGVYDDFKCIMEVDDRYGFNNWKSIDELNNELTEDVFIYNNKIVVSYFKYGSSALHFKIYDLKLNFETHKTYSVPNVSIIKEYQIYPFMNNLYLTTLSRTSKNEEINTIHNLDSNFNEISNYSIDVQNPNNKLIDFYINDNKLKLNIMDRQNSVLNCIDYTYLKIVKNKKEFLNYYINDYDVYINSNLMNKLLISSNVPPNAFGIYQEIYTVKQTNLEIVLPITKYYYPNVNLKNKETYDLGVVLKFNGIGYLNDEIISSNYKIEEAGKYVLEIIGSNDERKVINFNISPLSLTPTELEVQARNLIQIEKSNDLKANIGKVDVKNEVEAKIDNKAVVIIFSLTSIGIILGLVLPINFWRKKDA